ncbi:MAG: glucose-6-phosphate isomerase [Burkholderiales bacterium]|nr:glucose-6-phosphate isomerase [Burkholderiales bacterium]OJX06687.1 MAG: glucose-6-phosphate isomerase [Burkholderiales bacterium 70-64]
MSRSPSWSRAWDEVARLAAASSDASIAALLRDEADRHQRLTLEAAGVYLDLTHHRLPGGALDALLALADAAQVGERRAAMFSGEAVNFTEERPALHVALRGPVPELCDGGAIAAEVQGTLARMAGFAGAVREGRWRGATGQPIRDIVHIGIGGSHLGPQLVVEALSEAGSPVRCRFLSNVDPRAFERALQGLEPAGTLAIVASKSWRTDETARNASAVRRWFADGGIAGTALHGHLVGVTANTAAALESGLPESSLFPFHDWVGGRYSLWSAVGLPAMIAIGPQRFRRLLAGAHAMDRHFVEAPPARNAPLLLALVSLWNSLALASDTEAVVAYSDALRSLTAWLQQLQMESNGKRIDRDGEPVPWPTAPVIWGGAGTDGQHSYFQALHQGTAAHPVDFVVALPDARDPERRGRALVANALAQREALLVGRDGSPATADARAAGADARGRRLAAHRACPGNRPSTLLLLERLDPERLGALLALYEHKTAVLGWLWDIDSFDQWGVELGKVLAADIEPLLDPGQPLPDSLPAARRELLRRLRAAWPAR